MSEKVFVRKECHNVYEYVGKCPDCRTPQKSPYENNVDRVCHKCIFKRGEEIITSRMTSDKPYVGALITDWRYDSFNNLNIQFIDSQMKIHEMCIRERIFIRDYDITHMISERCEEPMIPKNDTYIMRIFKKFIK